MENVESLDRRSEPVKIKVSDVCVFGKDVQTFKCGFCSTSFSHFDMLLKHKKVHTNVLSSSHILDLDDVGFNKQETCENETNKATQQMMIIEESPEEITDITKFSVQTEKIDFQGFCDDFLSNDNDMFYAKDARRKERKNVIQEEDRVNDTISVNEKQLKPKIKNSKNSTITSKGTRSAKRSYTGEIHPGEYPYKCSFCDKRFKQVGHVNLHERTHTGGQKYICPYCNKKFNQLSHLKDHERIHTGEKPFMCSDCGKCFGYNSALKSHKKIHTGEKTYKCTFCEKTFNQLGNLRTHERLHTGELKHMCSECGKCYNTRSNLTRHACNRLNSENTSDGQVRLEEEEMMQQFEIQEQKLMM